jgi:simple sugar transport system permease protein
MATVILLAAIGGMYSERVGVLNIGLEGMMLLGAFFGVLTSFFTQSAWLGLLMAVVIGGVIGLIHAIASISFKANQIISSVAINILASGLTVYMCIVVFGTAATTPKVPGIQNLYIPYLSTIPVIGPIFFQQSPVVYMAVLIVIVSIYMLYNTPLGIRIRAVGEHPRAADTTGVNVKRIKYFGVIVSGMLAGLAGGFLSLSMTNYFNRGMTGGRGYIALAALIFGKRHPLGVTLACLLFGFAEAIQMRLQILNIPTQLVQILPYVLTMLVLIGAVGEDRAPSALGVPYDKAS